MKNLQFAGCCLKIIEKNAKIEIDSFVMSYLTRLFKTARGFKVNKLIILLLLALLIEGLGLPGGRPLAFYLVLATPFILLSKNYKNRESIVFPRKILLFFFAFFVLSFLSLILSGNIQRAFESYIYYVACFFIMVYSYNNQDRIKKPIIIAILAFSAIFSLYSAALLSRPSDLGVLLTNGYQFVFQSYGHNHLGDFLLLAIVILLFYIVKNTRKIVPILSLLFFLPFFVFSYSRSAYIDLLLMAGVFSAFVLKNKMKKNAIIIAVLTCLVLLFSVLFISTVKDSPITTTDAIHNTLKDYKLKNKYFTGRREMYLFEAKESVIEKPFFGVGPGNFVLASQKYAEALPMSETAHNIFIDVLVENGIPAGVIFIVIILLVFMKFRFELLPLITLAMLFNFQTDYTYRILSYLPLFFVLIGLFYKEKKDIEIGKFARFVPAILVIFSVLIFISNALSISNPKLSLYLYPLNENPYITLISNRSTSEYISIYTKLFSSDPDSLNFIGQKYESLGDIKNALYYFEKSFKARPLEGEAVKNKMESLKKKINAVVK